jgi:hypothetical protein
LLLLLLLLKEVLENHFVAITPLKQGVDDAVATNAAENNFVVGV